MTLNPPTPVSDSPCMDVDMYMYGINLFEFKLELLSILDELIGLTLVGHPISTYIFIVRI